MPGTNIFLSCVTSEFAKPDASFGELRQSLAAALRRGDREVKSQEDFRQSDRDILEHLDQYIRSCAVVVHLVGERPGSVANEAAILDLEKRFTSENRTFLDRQPQPLRDAIGDARDLTYTQWEAFLALHHRIPLFVYHTKTGQLAQKNHLDRLDLANPRRKGAGFQNENDLIARVIPDTYRHIPGRSEPLGNLPGSIGSRFKGRTADLRKVHHALRSGSGAITQAVVGLGGIGKTRLAVEYAYTYAPEYTACFLISGDSEARLQQSLSELTGPEILDLPEHSQDTERRLAAVKRWFASHDGWFLIIDNVDAPEARAAVQKRLGQFHNGTVLITSRLQQFDGQVDCVSLDVLTPEEAREFLLERTEGSRKTNEKQDAALDTLVEALGGLALALEQASAFITAAGIGFADYLNRFRSNHDHVVEWKDATLTEYEKTVATTWLTTFDELREPARDLLAELSLLAPAPIPREWFPGDEPALIELHLYSLTTYLEEPEDTFRVHRLVQSIVQGRLSGEGEQEWRRILKKLEAWAPHNGFEFETWEEWEKFEPHAGSIFSRQEKREDTEEVVCLISRFGSYEQYRNGNYRAAEILIRRSLSAYESLHGPEHPDTLSSVNNFALLLKEKGEYEKAEPLYRRALEARERVLGPEHPDTLSSLNNLAALLRVKGEYDKAEPLYRRALEGYERVMGAENPSTLTSLNNLAVLLSSKKKYGEAEMLVRRALEVRERVLGPEHPSTLSSVSNLALLLYAKGEYEVAEPLSRRALKGTERLLGAEHPSTLTSVNNQALLLKAKGEYHEAEPLFRRAIEGLEKVLGTGHPNTRTCKANHKACLDAMNKSGAQ